MTTVEPDLSWKDWRPEPIYGPQCVPSQRQSFDPETRAYTYVDVQVGNPRDYGRYRPIDMDENNRHSIDAYCARHPDRPRPAIGWSVCRSGFGRQDEGRRAREIGRVLTRADAEQWACELNALIVIGESAGLCL